ncbi:MAG: AzlD domain-containing protein [Olsenella sp.]|nr:AzlD domain-containing protein [Olsenella sp.]
MPDRIWASIFVMAAVTIAIRVTPVTFMRKPVENRFVRSFLTYVPYVTLAVMTFPAIVDSAGTPLAGAVALVVGIVIAWFGAGLPVVAAVCSVVAFLLALL